MFTLRAFSDVASPRYSSYAPDESHFVMDLASRRFADPLSWLEQAALFPTGLGRDSS
jgi:hypothetical protein